MKIYQNPISKRTNGLTQDDYDALADMVLVYCTTCDEEYSLPSCMHQCIFCDNHTLEEA
jgi:hypothetical protein